MANGRFLAAIRLGLDTKKKTLGTFGTAFEAAAARAQKRGPALRWPAPAWHNFDRHSYDYSDGAPSLMVFGSSQPSQCHVTALSLELFLQSGRHVLASGAVADINLPEARQLSEPFGHSSNLASHGS